MRDPATTIAFIIAGVLLGVLAWKICAALWRLFTGALRRTPDALESVARVAGKATAKTEQVSRRATQAFKDGRNSG
jgi:hypothetical protein